jgi:hypothetical protein
MTLAAKVDAMCAAALRRLHKTIDRRCQYAKGERPRETINRSTGQIYKTRAAEAHEATIRG